LALSVPVKLFAAKTPLFAVVNIAVLCLLTVRFAIWMNCGALMNQFFGNKKTLLFVRERDIQHATEEGAEGLRIWHCCFFSVNETFCLKSHIVLLLCVSYFEHISIL
jgi:hypothetical protein